MTPVAKLAGFALLLAALFGAGALAGALVDPDAAADRGRHGAADRGANGHDAGPAGSDANHDTGASDPGHDADTGDAGDAGRGDAEKHGDAAVRGLAVAADGLRLQLADTELRRARPQRLRFRVLGEDGAPLRDFDVTHTRRMHLIVVRRDLTGFQHLHPVLAADGSWSAPIKLAAAGSYRVFADFAHAGAARTLAADLHVDGPARLRRLPAPAPLASRAGYDVRIERATLRAGRPAPLRFAVTRDGAPVTTEPYLGAGGHLVALREGDLAFLHVHPEAHANGLAFATSFPSPGRYRLFLQFKHAGGVHTVAFTQAVTR